MKSWKKSAFQTKINHPGSETGSNQHFKRDMAVDFVLKVTPKNIKSVLLYKY